MRLDNILVPTDFSETAEHAVEQAVELAAMHRSRLELFHVVEPYGEPPSNMMASVREYLDKLQRDAEQTLASRAETILADGIDVAFSTAHYAAPVEAIAAKVKEAAPDLVVMGTHGRRGLQRFMLGSVTERVLRSVAVDVLASNEKAPLIRRSSGARRVLVPLDFSEFSKRALEAAYSLVAEDGAVYAVHVVDNPVYPAFYPSSVAPPPLATSRLAERVGDHFGQWLAGRDAELRVREGNPPYEILETINEIGPDLVVMGTRGLRGISHVLLGSATEKVVRRADAPVLTVH